jgi:hypothetical protein
VLTQTVKRVCPANSTSWVFKNSLFKGLFIWAKVIQVSEKTFRQVYKRDIALVWKYYEKLHCVHIRQKVFPCNEILLVDRRDLGDRDNLFPIWTQENFLSCQQLFITPFSIITSQLHCFQLRTTLNGKDFKFFSLGLCIEKQNTLLQRMHQWKGILYFDQ